MINGLYTSARGMIALEKQTDLVSNNMANVNTTGFKGQEAAFESFPEMLMSRIDETGSHVIGEKGTGSRVSETYTNFGAGQVRKTDNKLDFAIEGSGFFVVEAPWGRAYTRNGNFKVNQDGQLVTDQGYPVLGENGPIETNGRPINVGEGGMVQIDGIIRDQISLVDFDNSQQLERAGDNLYRAGEDTDELEAGGNIRQGYLEGSNVNVIKGMTQLIKATRMYELNQKMIQSHDETLSKAVNEVGRLG